jgi:hypothetical protein
MTAGNGCLSANDAHWYQLVADGMLIMAGGHERKPLNYDAL